MADQTFDAFPVRPGFPFEFSLAPLKTDPDNPAYPEGAEYESRITSNIDDPANGGRISTVAGSIVRIDDNNLVLRFPPEVTSSLIGGAAGSIAIFDIIRVDAGNERHLNIEVRVPIKRSIS